MFFEFFGQSRPIPNKLLKLLLKCRFAAQFVAKLDGLQSQGSQFGPESTQLGSGVLPAAVQSTDFQLVGPVDERESSM
jgi:hypothetical protein